MDHSHEVDTATTPSRRSFLKTSVAASAAGLAATPGYVAASDTIRVGVIGCGGRGTEAAEQAMAADKGVRLVAMADLLIDRAQEKRNLLRMKNREQVMVDDDHCFSGFEGYKKVI